MLKNIVKKIIKKKNKAFTMVELLLYMALVSGLLLVVSDILITSLGVKLESESVSYLEQDLRYVVKRMTFDINRATSVTTPAANGATSPSLVIMVSGSAFTYSASAGNLNLNDGSGSVNINSNQSVISNLYFRRLGNTNGKPTIKVNFTITSAVTNSTGTESKNVSTTLSTR